MCSFGEAMGFVPSDAVCIRDTGMLAASTSSLTVQQKPLSWQCVSIAGLQSVPIMGSCDSANDITSCAAKIDVSELEHDALFLVLFCTFMSVLCCCCIAFAVLAYIYQKHAAQRTKLG